MSMSAEKIVNLTDEKGGQMRTPFVPLTGNPENHNYADWYRALRDNSAAPASVRRKSQDQN
jgi:hypothetical protein